MSDGRRVLVTGGSRGIGLAVSRALAEGGWEVVVLSRDRARVDEAVASLAGDGHAGLVLDVADGDGWRNVAAAIAGPRPLDGLVTAAGVLGPIGPLGAYEPGGFRRTVEVNLIGTMLALHHVLPGVAERGGAAVTFSGGGATGPLARFDAYAASKAAVVRLTENVAATGVRVNCVAPGFIATEIHEETLDAGPEVVGADYYERTQAELERGGASLDEVSALVAFLLSAEAAGIGGKLIAAQWDPWREPDFRRRLAEDPDLATLRRIDEHRFGAMADDGRT